MFLAALRFAISILVARMMVSQFERCLKDNFLQLFLSRFCAYRWQWGRDECDRSMGLILSREANCFFFPQRGNFAGPGRLSLEKTGQVQGANL